MPPIFFVCRFLKKNSIPAAVRPHLRRTAPRGAANRAAARFFSGAVRRGSAAENLRRKAIFRGGGVLKYRGKKCTLGIFDF